MKILKTSLAARERPGQELDVYVGGNRVPESEITTKTSRCYVPASELYARTRISHSHLPEVNMSLILPPVQKCDTPEGIVIIPHASKLYLSYVKTKDLPWIHFTKQINSIGI